MIPKVAVVAQNVIGLITAQNLAQSGLQVELVWQTTPSCQDAVSNEKPYFELPDTLPEWPLQPWEGSQDYALANQHLQFLLTSLSTQSIQTGLLNLDLDSPITIQDWMEQTDVMPFNLKILDETKWVSLEPRLRSETRLSAWFEQAKLIEKSTLEQALWALIEQQKIPVRHVQKVPGLVFSEQKVVGLSLQEQKSVSTLNVDHVIVTSAQILLKMLPETEALCQEGQKFKVNVWPGFLQHMVKVSDFLVLPSHVEQGEWTVITPNSQGVCDERLWEQFLKNYPEMALFEPDDFGELLRVDLKKWSSFALPYPNLSGVFWQLERGLLGVFQQLENLKASDFFMKGH